MEYPFAMALLVACVPIIVALSRAIGPGRATLYAILGVFLLMPGYKPIEKMFGIFSFDKQTVAGLSLAVSVLLFDRETLARARLHWVDLPMLFYVVAPLISVLAGERSDVAASFDQAWMTFAGWGVPYALGRLYFADPDGPRRVAIATVIAGLLYIPPCFYEMVMGGKWYLRTLIFHMEAGAAYRLGGWKPTMMMYNGIELVTWMALATVLAFWLWACRERWRARFLPPWLPPVALLITTIACRGAYGYVILFLGLSSIALVLLTRTRWVLAPLLLLPVAYVALRASGLWDGHQLYQLASLVDGARAEGSVKFRIVNFENTFIRESIAHDLAFGLGGRYEQSWADGWWLSILKRGGLVAVAAHYSAFLLPAGLAIFRRSSRPPSASVEIGLALFLILLMIDSLHNNSLIAVSTLAGGALAGSFLGRSGWVVSDRTTRPSASSSAHMTYRLHDIVAGPPADAGVDARGRIGFVLAASCLLYIFGHAPAAGQEVAQFVGGLGSALLFGSTGAAVASFERRSLARAAAFGLAFAVLGVTFNLTFHLSRRPIWSADILQGMALSGLVVAVWRRATGGGFWAFAGLAVLASAWWAFEPYSSSFWGSQYLFFDPVADGQSLFPVLPWLVLSAIGAALVGLSPASCSALAIGLGLSALMAWGQGRPFGPPTKFPLNPTYALLGGSIASAAFAISGLVGRSKVARAASDWLGRRWLVFFYIHMGIALVLGRAGLTWPPAAWAALALLSMAATWAISEATGRCRPVFRRPMTWVVLAASTIAVVFIPRVPDLAVLVVAGASGLLFASRHDELAALMLGPPLADPGVRNRSLGAGDFPRYLAKVALVVAVLVAPELVGRLPAPFGTATRSTPDATAEARGSDRSRPIGSSR